MPLQINAVAAAAELTSYLSDVLKGRSDTSTIVPTGFRDLDELLGGGLRRGDLTVVAGVPGMGTSMLALNLARHAAVRHGLPTVFTAPDSSQIETLRRVIASEARVSVGHLRAGHITADDRDKLQRIQPRLKAVPLIVSAGWLGSTHIPLDAAIEDYAEGLAVAVADTQPDNADVVRGLKTIAQRYALAVVVTAKTDMPNLRDGFPRLRDLHGPHNMAAMADLIIVVHRDDQVEVNSRRPGEADLTILKHRYGPTCRLPPIAFQGHYARFVDMASEPLSPPN